MTNSEEIQKSIAVVGSGISGLSTAWMFAKAGWNVTVFESEDRLGGHSLTFHEKPDKNGKTYPPVDLGFQVFNFTTYPYLTAFFDELEVDHEPSDMSFSLSVDSGRLEWASHNLGSVFAQRSNAYSPRFLNMVREMFRFAREAPEVLEETSTNEFSTMTLGEYLSLRKYGDPFIYEYLLPMTAAVWSVPNKSMMEFPVVSMIRFWKNHHLLNPMGARPLWRVVKGRTEQYVNKVAAKLQELGGDIRLSSPVVRIKRLGLEDGKCTQVEVSTDSSSQTFDHCVLACHSNQALKILGEDATSDESRLLGAIQYQPNDVYLHSDPSQMPKLREAYASWNVLDSSEDNKVSGTDDMKGNRRICVTYWLNNLQNLPADTPLRLCTLNPITPPKPECVIAKMVLDHPVFSTEAIAAQQEINQIQSVPFNTSLSDNKQKSLGHVTNTWFAGAYLGFGFHEDGIRSATGVAHALGCAPKWAAPVAPGLTILSGPSPEQTWTQSFGLLLFKTVCSRAIEIGYFRILLPNGEEMHFGRTSPEIAQKAGEPSVVMRINNLSTLMKCVRDGDIGVGEAYMDKWFEVDDLIALFDLLLVNRDNFTKVLFSSEGVLSSLGNVATNVQGVVTLFTTMASWITNKTGTLQQYLRHLSRANTVAGSRRNIEEHYDLGNSMYTLFLDETMTYSSGIHTASCGADKFSNGKMITGPSGEEELGLYDAQLAKLDAIIKRAQLTSSDHVLEIGCGWGSFAIRAASTIGCKVTGITISTEQLEMAKKRVVEAGLEDKVNLIICDYRKLGLSASEAKQFGGSGDTAHHYKPGCFDKVVSIEMLEAVGHEHLPQYFEVVDRMLKPGGRALIQVISMPDGRYEEYINSSDFIRRHIFPGGHLPCMGALEWAASDTHLVLEDVNDIGPDYAITLRMWRENFEARHDEIIALGYPEKFYRKFIFYFAYCEAGFTNKYIFDWHLSYRKSLSDQDHKLALQKTQAGSARELAPLPSGSVVTSDEDWIGSTTVRSNDSSNSMITKLLTLVWFLSCTVAVVSTEKWFLVGVPLAMIATSIINAGAARFTVPTEIRVGSIKALTWSQQVTSLLLSGFIATSLLFMLSTSDTRGTQFGDLIYGNNHDKLLDNSASSLLAFTPRMLVVVASGYYVADLFISVQTGLWRANFARIGYLAGALICFCVALVKNLCLPYLSLFLMVELHQFFLHLRGLMALKGMQLHHTTYQVVWALSFTTLIGARLIPHAMLSFMSWNDSALAGLSSRGMEWTVANAGMAADMVYNAGIAIAMVSAFQLDYANGWNTDILLGYKKFKRTREELIETMSEEHPAGKVKEL